MAPEFHNRVLEMTDGVSGTRPQLRRFITQQSNPNAMR
jgi:hypothetical protein